MNQITRGQVIAIDGKKLRGSQDQTLGHGAIDMVSAWAAENYLVLGQVKVDDKSNEIKIEQNPGKGVITKNRKAATTTLLPIPELLQIVKEWDDQVRRELPFDTPWFAYIDHFDHLMPPGKDFKEWVNGRRMACIKGMKRLCAQANVPYKSPHKLRPANAIYGIKHARDMQELKAVSQNLMHSSISITDGIYGNLNNNDMMKTIAGLASNAEESNDLRAFLQLMIKLQSNPELLNQMLQSIHQL